MGIGIVELISILLGLSGFSVHPNPKAMSADQALQYAIADADVVAEVDLTSLVPGNYTVLTQLPDQPQIKSSPELSKVVRQAITQLEGMRGMVQTASGLDLTKDLSDATVFVQLAPGAEPTFVASLHGKFGPGLISRIATSMHQTATKIGGGMILENGNEPALGVTRSGVMLAGTAALVRDRLDDGWKAPSHAAGTNLGYAAEVISGKPVLAIVMTMSKAAREHARQVVGATNFLGDLITRHKAAAFVIHHDGIGWTWVDSTKAGFEAMAMVSDGMIDVMRAAQIAPRGLAKIVIGGLDSYRGQNPQLDEVIKHKDDILKLVSTYTGDGNFKVTQSKDPVGMKLAVRATGKSLSEVLPAGLVIPFAVLGFWTRGSAAAPPTMVTPVAPPAPSKPPALTPPHR